MKYTILSAILFLSFGIVYAEETLSITTMKEKIAKYNLDLVNMEIEYNMSMQNQYQSRKYSNPELEVELENFGGNEIGVFLSQPFELGGKREIRIEAANVETEMIQFERTNLESQLNHELMRRVIPIIALERQVVNLDSIINTTQLTLETIENQIALGASNHLDKIRVELELDELLIEQELLEIELRNLNKELASLWLGNDDSFNVSCEIDLGYSLPKLNDILDSIDSHPEVKLYQHERKLRNLRIQEAQSKVVPDISVGLGFVRNNEEKENAIVLSAGLELPVFDRNQVEINNSHLEKESLENEVRMSISDRMNEVILLYNELLKLDKQIINLSDMTIPKLAAINETLLDYYKKGKVNYIDVLESQIELNECKNNLFELQVCRIEMLIDLSELSNYQMKIIN